MYQTPPDALDDFLRLLSSSPGMLKRFTDAVSEEIENAQDRLNKMAVQALFNPPDAPVAQVQAGVLEAWRDIQRRANKFL